MCQLLCPQELPETAYRRGFALAAFQAISGHICREGMEEQLCEHEECEAEGFMSVDQEAVRGSRTRDQTMTFEDLPLVISS